MPDDEETDENKPVETSVYEAKIAELNAKIAEENARAVALESELNAAKAANYDLLMATPAETAVIDDVESNDVDDIVDIDDLFEKKG